jgi:hypothetical protein
MNDEPIEIRGEDSFVEGKEVGDEIFNTEEIGKKFYINNLVEEAHMKNFKIGRYRKLTNEEVVKYKEMLESYEEFPRCEHLIVDGKFVYNYKGGELTNEEFKTHKYPAYDYNVQLEASNYGRIKIDGKIVEAEPENKSDDPFKHGLVVHINGYGIESVHRLVKETFDPIINMEQYEVYHANNNVNDNRLENLLWISTEDLRRIDSKFNVEPDKPSSENETLIQGFLKTLQETKDKNGDSMAFGVLGPLEDSEEFHNVKLTFFSKTWNECRSLLTLKKEVILKGRFDDSIPGKHFFTVSGIVTKKEYESLTESFVSENGDVVVISPVTFNFSRALTMDEFEKMPSAKDFFQKLGINLPDDF